MKNVLQGFRDLPDYPLIAVRLIAFWFAIFGVGNLIVGATLIIPNQYDYGQKFSQKDLQTLRRLIPISSQLSFVQGMKPYAFEVVMDIYSPGVSYPDLFSGKLSDTVYSKYKNSAGAYVIFWGALYLLTALLLVVGFRRMTLLILAVWIIYGCIVLFNFMKPTNGLPLFSNFLAADSTDNSMNAWTRETFKPPLLSIFIMIVIPLFIGAMLILDERLKAYFKKGEFAERYRTYRTMRRSGGKNLHSLWTMEKKS